MRVSRDQGKSTQESNQPWKIVFKGHLNLLPDTSFRDSIHVNCYFYVTCYLYNKLFDFLHRRLLSGLFIVRAK